MGHAAAKTVAPKQGADVANVGTGWKLDLPKPVKSALREFKVAIWATDELCPTSVEIQSACDSVAEALRGCGAVVDTAARPAIDMRENGRVYSAMMASSTAGGGADPGVSCAQASSRSMPELSSGRLAVLPADC